MIYYTTRSLTSVSSRHSSEPKRLKARVTFPTRGLVRRREGGLWEGERAKGGRDWKGNVTKNPSRKRKEKRNDTRSLSLLRLNFAWFQRYYIWVKNEKIVILDSVCTWKKWKCSVIIHDNHKWMTEGRHRERKWDECLVVHVAGSYMRCRVVDHYLTPRLSPRLVLLPKMWHSVGNPRHG